MFTIFASLFVRFHNYIIIPIFWESQAKFPIFEYYLNMYGKIIKELRTDKNLTQKQLAECLHTNFRNISRYEREEIDLSTDMIIKICKFFEVSSDYLLGLKDE